MDHLMADLRDESAAVGDVVERVGEQVRADEVAEWAGTIAYEVLRGIGPRVPRVYLRGGRPVQVNLRSSWVSS